MKTELTIKKTAFYSHSNLIMNTEREKLERDFLESIYKVNCPNRDIAAFGGDYSRMVEESDVIVASEYEGYVGRGVFTNVLEGLNDGKEVYAIRENQGQLKLKKVVRVRRYDVNDWKFKFGVLDFEGEVCEVCHGRGCYTVMSANDNMEHDDYVCEYCNGTGRPRP